MRIFFTLLLLISPACAAEKFLAGVDANYVLAMERAGKTWRAGEAPADPFALLAKSGVTDFRVRLWTGDDGMNGLTYATETARRAQAAGMKPYLVIFLSDSWSDFVKQPVPAIWKDLDEPKKLAAIEAYAARVTKHFADAGIAIDLYEIGNEIDFGICGVFEEEWPKRVSLDYMRAAIWPRMTPIIKAAQAGVRHANANAKFTLHLSQWNNAAYCSAFWQFMLAAGVQLDFAGISYFPTSSPDAPQRTLAFLQAQVAAMRQAVDRPVLICETGYPSAEKFTGQFAEWNKPIDGYALDAAGQAKWLADFFATARATPGLAGAFYWSPEWYASDAGLWDAFALFDAAGKARPALQSLRKPD